MGDPGSNADASEVNRLVFFSDAVVAIAITLLALELPIPKGITVHELWYSVRQNDGHYLAFIISFLVIAAAWSPHHEVFRFAQRSDQRLRTLNTVWLMMIVLTPFATRLLTAPRGASLDAHAIRFGFYALLQALAAGMIALMSHRLTRGGFLSAGAPLALYSSIEQQSYLIMLGFGLSIPLLFATTYAWILWIAIPAVGGIIRYLARRPATLTNNSGGANG